MAKASAKVSTISVLPMRHAQLPVGAVVGDSGMGHVADVHRVVAELDGVEIVEGSSTFSISGS
jgi:hypothetical protein